MGALSMLTLAATLASGSVLPGGSPPLSHGDEIKVFASTAAVAWTTLKLCAGLVMNQSMIENFRDSLHMTASDLAAVDRETRFAIQVLVERVPQSTNVQQWCDETYELYGPTGRMIPDLLKRE